MKKMSKTLHEIRSKLANNEPITADDVALVYEEAKRSGRIQDFVLYNQVKIAAAKGEKAE
jgi:hypothetical protein